jgi:hypothetical protein
VAMPDQEIIGGLADGPGARGGRRVPAPGEDLGVGGVAIFSRRSLLRTTRASLAHLCGPR